MDHYREQVRRERSARLEREIEESAIRRMIADQERERLAAVAAEVGLGPDAPPDEVARLHNLKRDNFWSDLIARSPTTSPARFRTLAAEVGVDLSVPNLFDPYTAVWNAMRAAGRLPRFYWQAGERVTALSGLALLAIALLVTFFASAGFVLTNLSTGAELRGDRGTPAVALAQRTADTIAKSREDECRKRGDRCRDLETLERKALADLAEKRAEVRAATDAMSATLRTDAAALQTVQAGAMVGMCLAAGYIIAYGAGLIWPRG